MSYKIQCQSSNKQAISEHGESVLESAIRAGMVVNYGCSQGNCGLCIAQLVSGEIKKLNHYDYQMSEADQRAGKFLMCAHTAIQDLTIDTELLGEDLRIEPQSLSVKTRAVSAVSEQIRVLTLQPSRSERLRFLAGQYARISRGTMRREYAIGSCPCDARRLEFHIEWKAGDGFCDYIFNTCAKGDVLEIEAPFGNFTFHQHAEKPLIFLAVGSGFASIKSLLEHITAQESERPIYFYWIADKGGHYLNNLCRSWDHALDQMQYQRWESEIDNLTGMADYAKQILEQHATLSSADLYCCAPDETLQVISQEMWKAPATWRFFYERIHA